MSTSSPLSAPLLSCLDRVLEASRGRGLLGPGELGVHINNARGFAEAVPPRTRVLDLGSGGGVPGIPLAVHRPDLRVTLLDSASRRVRFLEEAIGELSEVDVGFDERVRTLWGRAEDLARSTEHRGNFDVVVSRSFGRPSVTAECARPFMVSDGLLIVSEPPLTNADRWPPDGLERLGLRFQRSYIAGDSTFAVLCAQGECPSRLPRRTGVAARRPAF